jgi:hypothetical protein
MEIKVEDYLSQAEIKAIILDEVKTKIRSDSERILGNLPYYIAQSFIQELLSERDLKALEIKVKELLSKDQSIKYVLFQDPSAWDSNKIIRVSSVIQKTIEQNLDIIKNKTIQSLESIDEDKMTTFLEENLDTLICTMLEKLSTLKEK